MFRIHTQVLDLHYHTEEQAPAFQDRARRLYYGALLAEMEAVMEKHDLRESIFRIHRLELDLGEMDDENFDSEWVKRFRERFEEELEKRLRLIRTEKGTSADSEIPLKKQPVEIFEHYLLHGSLPWNAGNEPRTPQGMAEELLNHQLSALILMLKKHGNNEKLVRRLVFQLSEKQVIRIIGALQPTEAKFIVETVEKVDRTRRKESFVKADSVHFRSQLWELALRYILEDRGSYFNTKEFVRSLLFGVADHFNMERAQLILQFYKAVLHLQKAISFSAGLWRILAEIYTETLETDQRRFPFTPEPHTSETAASPWYEGIISPSTDDMAAYVAEPLPFVVPPEGFVSLRKPASKTVQPADVPGRFVPYNRNGKFSEQGIPEEDRQRLPVTSQNPAPGFTNQEAVEKATAPVSENGASEKRTDEAGRPNHSDTVNAIENPGNNASEPEKAPLLDFRLPTKETTARDIATSSAEGESVSGTPIVYDEEETPTETAIETLVARLDEADMTHVTERMIFEAEYAEALSVWLWERGSDSSFRRRLGSALRTVEQFEKIVEAVDAPHAGYIADFSKRLQTEQEEHRIFPATTLQFRKDQYYVLLSVLLTRRGSYFNKKSFVKQVLRQLAQLYGLEFRLLIETLVQAIPKSMHGLAQLPEILQLLYDLHEDEIRVQHTQNKNTAVHSSALVFERVLLWVQTQGKPAEAARFGPLNGMDFPQLWETWLGLDETDEEALEVLLQHPVHIRYLVQTLSEPVYRQTVRQLVPVYRQPALRLFESVMEEAKNAGLAGSLSAAELTQAVRTWVWQRLVHPQAALFSAEQVLEAIVAFLTETLNLASETVPEKIGPLLRKAIPGHRYAETALRQWEQTHKPALAPYGFHETANAATPDVLTQHFLKTWGHASRHSEAFQQEVWRLLTLLAGKGEAEVLRFLNRVFSTQTFPEFLYKQAQAPLVALLAKFPLQAYGYFLKAIVQDFRYLLRTASVTVPQAEDELTKAMIHAWFLGERGEKAFAERMLQRLAESKKAIPKDLKLLLRQHALAHQPDLKSKLLLHLSTGEMAPAAPHSPASKTVAMAQNTPKPGKQPAERSPGIPFGNKADDQVLDSIGTNNAGLVLAWPFLTTYFKRLNLTENNAFTGEASQHRAVHLLNLLVEPDTAPEPELVLAKLLCGLQPADPIPAAFTPTDDEKALAESLLKGIIGQWKELSNTSVASFRETFLKRQGMLYQKSAGWELHPHRKTYDVLLDKLPWGIQIVKLPWMKTSLFCKWR